MTEQNQLGSVEESQIRKAVFELFKSCPFIPESVSKRYGDMEKNSIGMFSRQGSGQYLKQYISGSYEAQLPFSLLYRAKPTTSGTIINAEELLESIAQWLCGRNVQYNGVAYQMEAFPLLTDNRKIEKIEAGNVYIVGKEQDGTINYQVSLNLRYSKKREEKTGAEAFETADISSQMNTFVQALKKTAEELKASFLEGFWGAFGDYETRIDSIRKSLDSVKQSAIAIFTDAEVLSSADTYAKSLVQLFGSITGSMQIRQEENDIGVVYPSGDLEETDNCYIVEDNFLIYGKGSEELAEIAEKVFEIIHKASYQPFEAETKGNPCVMLGEAVRFHTIYTTIESYVLHRTLKGIQALKDHYAAEGLEIYGERVNGIQKSIIQLRGKTNTLTRTVEETRLEIRDIEKGLTSSILQTAEKIETEVERATEAEGNLSSKITQTANDITAEVRRATGAEGELSAKIRLTEESIATEVQRATSIEGNLSSRITQTAESISSEVTRATNAEAALSSRITQTAESIELKVSKGDVSSQLSLESGKVEIRSNRFVLDATNCSISADGKITAKDVDLKGRITADSGMIGGFSVTGNSIYNGKSSFSSGNSGVYIGTDGLSIGKSGYGSAFQVDSSGNVNIESNGTIIFDYGTSKMSLSASEIVFGLGSALNTKLNSNEVRVYNSYLDKDGLHVKSSATYYTEIKQNEISFGSGVNAKITCGGKEALTISRGALWIDTTSVSIRGHIANSGSVVIGGYNDKIGFFNSSGTTKTQVHRLSTTTQPSNNQLKEKLNELIDVLNGYGLI